MADETKSGVDVESKAAITNVYDANWNGQTHLIKPLKSFVVALKKGTRALPDICNQVYDGKLEFPRIGLGLDHQSFQQDVAYGRSVELEDSRGNEIHLDGASQHDVDHARDWAASSKRPGALGQPRTTGREGLLAAVKRCHRYHEQLLELGYVPIEGEFRYERHRRAVAERFELHDPFEGKDDRAGQADHWEEPTRASKRAAEGRTAEENNAILALQATQKAIQMNEDRIAEFDEAATEADRMVAVSKSRMEDLEAAMSEAIEESEDLQPHKERLTRELAHHAKECSTAMAEQAASQKEIKRTQAELLQVQLQVHVGTGKPVIAAGSPVDEAVAAKWSESVAAAEESLAAAQRADAELGGVSDESSRMSTDRSADENGDLKGGDAAPTQAEIDAAREAALGDRGDRPDLIARLESDAQDGAGDDDEDLAFGGSGEDGGGESYSAHGDTTEPEGSDSGAEANAQAQLTAEAAAAARAAATVASLAVLATSKGMMAMDMFVAARAAAAVSSPQAADDQATGGRRRIRPELMSFPSEEAKRVYVLALTSLLTDREKAAADAATDSIRKFGELTIAMHRRDAAERDLAAITSQIHKHDLVQAEVAAKMSATAGALARSQALADSSRQSKEGMLSSLTDLEDKLSKAKDNLAKSQRPKLGSSRHVAFEREAGVPRLDRLERGPGDTFTNFTDKFTRQFFAVHHGRGGVNGVFGSWPEARPHVHGAKDCLHKRFDNLVDASDFAVGKGDAFEKVSLKSGVRGTYRGVHSPPGSSGSSKSSVSLGDNYESPPRGRSRAQGDRGEGRGGRRRSQHHHSDYDDAMRDYADHRRPERGDHYDERHHRSEYRRPRARPSMYQDAANGKVLRDLFKAKGISPARWALYDSKECWDAVLEANRLEAAHWHRWLGSDGLLELASALRHLPSADGGGMRRMITDHHIKRNELDAYQLKKDYTAMTWDGNGICYRDAEHYVDDLTLCADLQQLISVSLSGDDSGPSPEGLCTLADVRIRLLSAPDRYMRAIVKINDQEESKGRPLFVDEMLVIFKACEKAARQTGVFRDCRHDKPPPGKMRDVEKTRVKYMQAVAQGTILPSAVNAPLAYGNNKPDGPSGKLKGQRQGRKPRGGANAGETAPKDKSRGKPGKAPKDKGKKPRMSRAERREKWKHRDPDNPTNHTGKSTGKGPKDLCHLHTELNAEGERHLNEECKAQDHGHANGVIRGRRLSKKEFDACFRMNICCDCGQKHDDYKGTCPSDDASINKWKDGGGLAKAMAGDGQAQSAQGDHQSQAESEAQTVARLSSANAKMLEENQRLAAALQASQRGEPSPGASQQGGSIDHNSLLTMSKGMATIAASAGAVLPEGAAHLGGMDSRSPSHRPDRPVPKRSTSRSADPAMASPASVKSTPFRIWRPPAAARCERGFEVALGGVCTTGEAIGSPQSLFLIAQIPSNKIESAIADSDTALPALWEKGGGQDALACRNTQPIRFPATGSLPSPDIEPLIDDLTVALMLARSDEYDRVVVPRELVELGDTYESVGTILDAFVSCRDPDHEPEFAKGADEAALRRRRERTHPPLCRDLRMVSICCGVSGEFRAAQALGVNPAGMVFTTVCPEDCAVLYGLFPGSIIIEGDIRDPRVEAALQANVAEHGPFDVGMLAQLCQPSSDASTVHDPSDPLLQIGIRGAEVLQRLGSTIDIIENVSSFERRQKATYKKVRQILGEGRPEGHKFVSELISDTRDLVQPMKRRRVYIFGTDSVDLSTLEERLKKQKAMSDNAVTLRDALCPFVDLRGKKGMFIPWLRGCPRGNDGKPQRVISLDTQLNALTGHYGPRGGLTPDGWRDYRICDADCADSKDEVLYALPWMFGVIMGCAQAAPWSTARSCGCAGCLDKHGKRRSGGCGARQRGGMISPPSMLFKWQVILPAVASGTPDLRTCAPRPGATDASAAAQAVLESVHAAVRAAKQVMRSVCGTIHADATRPGPAKQVHRVRCVACRDQDAAVSIGEFDLCRACSASSAPEACAGRSSDANWRRRPPTPRDSNWRAARLPHLPQAQETTTNDRGDWRSAARAFSRARTDPSTAEGRHDAETGTDDGGACAATDAACAPATPAIQPRAVSADGGGANADGRLGSDTRRVAAGNGDAAIIAATDAAYAASAATDRAKTANRHASEAKAEADAAREAARDAEDEAMHLRGHALRAARLRALTRKDSLTAAGAEGARRLLCGPEDAPLRGAAGCGALLAATDAAYAASAATDRTKTEAPIAEPSGKAPPTRGFSCASAGCCNTFSLDSHAEALGCILINGHPDAAEALGCILINGHPEADGGQANVVSDEAAELYLRTVHQRLGHAGMRVIRQLHRSGAVMGPEISEDQFECLQLWCPTCMRHKAVRHPHRRRRKKRSGPNRLRVLDCVYTDLVGPFSVPSLPYHGGRNPTKSRGGNLFAVFYVDKKTHRVFPDFIGPKTEYEQSIIDSKTDMTIEARDSVDYKGVDIEVKMFSSDRDSNLTSDEAVARMLAHSVKHGMSTSDKKNQTPLLDNIIRRVTTTSASILDASGLGPEYWEFAMRCAVTIVNMLPTERHQQHHSAMRQWTGRRQDLTSLRTFGADAYPMHMHELGDKLGAKAPGGKGRYRLVGYGTGKGVESNGYDILDTSTRMVANLRDVDFDEDMDRVKSLSLPKENWPGVGTDTAGKGADLDSLIDGGPEQATEPPSAPLITPPPGDHDEPTEETLDMPVPKGRRVGDVRLKSARARSSRERTLNGLTKLDLDQPISLMQVNPKRVGGKSRARYEIYKEAKTVREFLELGGTTGDLKHDRGKGFINVLPWDGKKAVKPSAWLSLSAAANMGGTCTWARAMAVKAEQASEDAYAAQVGEFFRDRIAGGACGPDEVADMFKALPVWEAHATFGDRADKALGLVRQLAVEFALWHHDGETLGYRETITALAEEVHTNMQTSYDCHLSNSLDGIRTVSVPTPKNYKEAVSGEFRVFWEEAIRTEIENLKEHKVFEWDRCPPNRKMIDSNWAWKVKPDSNGMVSKFKARLVARGFRQQYGVDYMHTHASVAKLVTFRMQLAEAARRGMDISFADIRSAYLEASLKIKQYMSPPQGVTPPDKGMCMRLDRALYGLKQAGREWAIKFRKNLLDWGFKASSADPCLFIKGDGKSQVRVLLFVDDLAIFSDSTKKGKALRADLMKRIKDEGYDYSEGHDENVYLGMQVTSRSPTCAFLSQKRYIDDIMVKYGFVTADTMPKPTRAPAPSGSVSKRDCFQGDPSANPHGRRFRELCGALRWIEQCTRPDIAAALGELSKVQINPGEVHVARLDHLMRYVHTTRHKGLVFGGRKKRTADSVIVGYVDSDWAGDPDTRYSRGGYLYTAWQTPVSWASYKMKAIAASSCESEYMSASKAVREARWLRYLLSDMGYGDLTVKDYGKLCDQDFARVRLSDLVSADENPITCFGDNKAAIAISNNPVLHRRSKHVHIAFHIVQREVQKGHCVFGYIPTKDNVADMLTKTLTRVPNEYLCDKIMAELREGVLYDVYGEEIDFTPAPPIIDDLYQSVPPGLDPSRGDDQRCWPEGFDKAYIESCCEDETRGSLPVHGPDGDSRMLGHRTAVAACVNATIKFVADCVSNAVGVSLEQWCALSRLLKDIPNCAIVDSGASFTYVHAKQALERARPGSGYVRVANGQREAITEIGELGPLTGAQKVGSFTRTLVSVSDLTEQFGVVIFDKNAVHVGSEDGALITKIGDLTPQRLYSFDLDALEGHALGIARLQARAA